MSDYERVHKKLNAVPGPLRRVIFRESLEQAAGSVPELESLRQDVGVVGIAGMRELAHKLCLLGERNGWLDRVFPISAIEDGGNDAQLADEG